MTIEELNVWVSDILDIEPSIDNIEELRSFIRFSPEKFADKIGQDRTSLVKEFDIHKKIVHNKILIFDKSNLLKGNNPDSFGFYFDNVYVKSIKCICIKYFSIKYKGSNYKFYPFVKYLYYFTDEENIIFPYEDTIRKIYISKQEFYEHFQNLRDYKIQKIVG